MKKFLLIIAFIVGVFAMQAQTVKSYMYPAGTYTKTYTGMAADTLGVGQTTWGYEMEVNKPDGLFYNTRVKVSDKTTGANGVATVKLQGKYFDTDSYSDITTVTWTGVGSTDSIIPFQNVSTKNYYRYIKVLVTRTGGMLKVDYIKNSFKK
jgi:hypothetical protein